MNKIKYLFIFITISCSKDPKKLVFPNFSIFEEFPILIAKLDVPNQNYKIELYHIPSNASSQDYIQVRIVYSESTFKVIKNYKRYNFGKLNFITDTSMQIMLIDTLRDANTALMDTIILPAKNWK